MLAVGFRSRGSDLEGNILPTIACCNGVNSKRSMMLYT
jgi:hypothetical protein